jgi:superfamily II DNA/RNA helicase
MGARGKAISFVSREEGRPLTEIELLINKQIVEATYPGFKSSAPPEERRPERVEKLVAQPATTTAAKSDWGADEPSAPGTRRTLGGRFKPSRRRRR